MIYSELVVILRYGYLHFRFNYQMIQINKTNESNVLSSETNLVTQESKFYRK